MRFVETKISGAFVVEPERRGDERGWFARAWCAEEFRAAGLAASMVQANMSFNEHPGTVRGLHLQRAPFAEAKLVRCVAGSIFDVVVDVRPGSPGYGRWFGVELSADNRLALYIPEGCAHGYQALTPGAEVFYQVSAPYAPEAEAGFRYDDLAFGIEWPLPVTQVSDKDASWPAFRDERAAEASASAGPRD